MPILALDKKGNIIQTDSRFNGAQGIGAVADMVDQGDVTELSLNPEDIKRVQRDREAIRNLDNKIQQAKIKKYAEDKKKQAFKETQRAAYLEKKYREAKKQQYRDQLYKNTSYLAASQKPGMDQMSGVSGYGFSADGRKPFLNQSAQDYQPILQANVAFGGDAQEWGNETGLGYHSNTDVKKHGFAGLGATNYLRQNNENLNEAATAEVINEGMTPNDEFALKQFDEGSTTIPYHHPNYPQSTNTLVVSNSLKNQLASINSSSNTSAEMAKVISQGWGYSIIDDGEDNVRLVKVAYHWALPIYVPDNTANTYTKEYAAGYSSATNMLSGMPGLQWGVLKKMPQAKKTTWNALRPVIEAAAKEYAAKSDEYGVWQGRDYSKLNVAKATAQKSDGGSFLKKLFSKGTGNFSHPLIKQGLLK